VDGAPLHEGGNDIAFDAVRDQEQQHDPERLAQTLRESHQHRCDRSEIRHEGKQPGDHAEHHGGRHPEQRKPAPNQHADDDHVDELADQPALQAGAHLQDNLARARYHSGTKRTVPSIYISGAMAK
jgi:hypothetical protein